MKRDVPHILLVNPWIHDFAAYDFWAKPLGLLTLAALAHPDWEERPAAFDIAYALRQAIDGLDLVRAQLLSEVGCLCLHRLEGSIQFHETGEVVLE